MDGTGIQDIDDPNLAQKLRKKVNDFNWKLGGAAVVITLLFAAIPLN